MIFTPNPNEIPVLNMVHHVRNENYVLLRLTYTMVDKNNLDANSLFRNLLLSWGMVDYEQLQYGGAYGITYDALFLQRNGYETVRLKFYRVNNARGDRRFSIETLRRRVENGELCIGDLLYISIYRRDDGNPQLFFIDLTNNTPSEANIAEVIGVDETSRLFEAIRPRLFEIVHGGFYNNSKGFGPLAPKDVGDTLESLLGIETNNRDDADINGLIEVKSKAGRTLDTLFTLRPRFEGTRVAEYEPIDRNRVSAFARIYGYESDRHPGYSSLYITIGSLRSPQNNQGFYLVVDEHDEQVNLVWENPYTHRREIAAFWPFSDLEMALYQKHPATLWVSAESREQDGMVQFKYNEIEFTRAPQFTTFLSLINDGKVTYDWRGYTTIDGPYSGKNHGNAWRVKPYAKEELFGELERIVW